MPKQRQLSTIQTLLTIAANEAAVARSLDKHSGLTTDENRQLFAELLCNATTHALQATKSLNALL